MNESVAITKEADAKNSFASTRNSDEGIHRAQNEPERQLGSLRGVIGDIKRDGGTPSAESIATQLSGMHTAQRAPVLSALQKTHGNQYVQRVVAGIQAKLVVGQPGDKYEQEADRVAEQVSRAPEPQVQRQPVEEKEEEKEEEEELVQTKPISDDITPPIQRQEATEEEKEEGEGGLVQTKPAAEQITPLIQRQAEGEEEEEEEVVQTRSETSTTSSGPIRYVQRAVAWIQAKLKVGQPGDKYEQEADRVADAVMRMPEPAVQRQVEGGEEKEEEEVVQTKTISDGITPSIQRQEATEDEKDEGGGELVQTKLIAGQTTPLIQRQVEGEEEDEEEVVQTRSETSVTSSNHASMMDSVTHAINTRGSGGPMNRSTRHTLESYMGVDLSGVRVHTDSTSHQACTALRAHAFTHRNHIWLGRGQSQNDLRLMSHETTHVLQQGGIARRKPLGTRKSPDLVQTLPIARAEQTAIPREPTPAHTAPTISPAAPVEIRRSSTSPATETATPAPVEVTQAQSRATERTAPEAAAAPGEATPAAVAGVAPEDQERLQGVMGRLDEAATQQEGPAASSASQRQASEQAASEASDATPSPANEAAAIGQATQVETMNAQEAGEIDQRSFLEIVRQRLQELERTLDNPEKMDEFREGHGASGLQAGLLQTTNQQAGEAQSAIRSATEAEPAPTNERVPEQLRERAAPGRVSNLQAQEVLPQPRTESEVSLEESRQSVEEQLTEENLTEERLRRANDPRFTAVQESREAVNEHADNAPQAFREEEQTLLSEQEGTIVAEEATAAREMEQAQEQSQREIDTEQQATMTEEERQRQEVSDHIESIYTSTQQTVEEKLNWLGEEVTRQFTEGEERARARFEEFVDDEMTAWKLRRYGGRALIPIVGVAIAAGTWIADQFRDINEFPEVEQIYENGKSRYIADLDVVIVGVANMVEETLAWCQTEIQNGRNEIQEYLERLPESLREVGEQTSRRVSERFDELRDNVEERRNSLADQLVESYRQAREALDLRIEEMQAENRGLVSQFMDGLRGVLEAIRNFRDRLMSIIGEAGDVIELILEDPIGFLKNLLDALKGGFRQFSSNIWDHLRRGLMGWLFGTLATAGVTIPSEFSLRSVIGLILQILGITYDRIRAKVARIIGERNVAILERVWGYVSTLIREGPIGLWEQIKDDLGNLKDVVIEGIKQWVITRIITAAVTRLVSMFNPVGAIIQAVLAIYNTVMFFIERINQIMELVQGIVRSLGAIVRGQLSAASNRVEQVMGLTIPIIISFLARLLGLGGIAGTISRIIGRVRRRVDRAIDRGLRRIVRRIRGMLRRGRAVAAGVVNWWRTRKQFRSGAGESHVLSFRGRGRNVQLMIASSSQTIEAYLNSLAIERSDPRFVRLTRARQLTSELQVITRSDVDPAKARQIVQKMTHLSELLIVLGGETMRDIPQRAKWNFSAGHSEKVASVETLSTLTSRGGSTPAGSSPAFDYLRERNMTDRGDKWVRMHLISERVGGSGGARNWVPAPNSINTGSRVTSFESAAKRLVERRGRQNQPNVVWIRTIAALRSPNPSFGNVPGFPRSVSFRAGLYFRGERDWQKDSSPRVSGDVSVREPTGGEVPSLSHPSYTALSAIEHPGVDACSVFSRTTVRHMRTALETGSSTFGTKASFITRLRAVKPDTRWQNKITNEITPAVNTLHAANKIRIR